MPNSLFGRLRRVRTYKCPTHSQAGLEGTKNEPVVEAEILRHEGSAPPPAPQALLSASIALRIRSRRSDVYGGNIELAGAKASSSGALRTNLLIQRRTVLGGTSSRRATFR